MPDDPAFIRTIAVAPDDDAPRLVYADVLEESGDPAKMARAEFIRVQIEKSRLVPDTPRWSELWHRDTALLDWALQWRAELPPCGGHYGGFIRGFIDEIREVMNADAFLESAAEICDRVPLRRVEFREMSRDQFRRLVALDVVPAACAVRAWIHRLPEPARHVWGPWAVVREEVV